MPQYFRMGGRVVTWLGKPVTIEQMRDQAFFDRFVESYRYTTVDDDDEPAARMAKCEYCGTYGDVGRCAACGAPNRPIECIEVTAYQDSSRKFIEQWKR